MPKAATPEAVVAKVTAAAKRVSGGSKACAAAPMRGEISASPATVATISGGRARIAGRMSDPARPRAIQNAP
jgi:hypothetical protein